MRASPAPDGRFGGVAGLAAPLADQAHACGLFVRRHLLDHRFESSERGADAVPGGKRQPEKGLNPVLLDALARHVHVAETGLGGVVPGFRRLPVPFGGAGVIERHAVALAVEDAEVEAGIGVAAAGGAAQPAHGLRHVLGDAVAHGVHRADVALGQHVPGLGRFEIPGEGRRRVGLDAVAVGMERADPGLGLGVAGLGQRQP